MAVQIANLLFSFVNYVQKNQSVFTIQQFDYREVKIENWQFTNYKNNQIMDASNLDSLYRQKMRKQLQKEETLGITQSKGRQSQIEKRRYLKRIWSSYYSIISQGNMQDQEFLLKNRFQIDIKEAQGLKNETMISSFVSWFKDSIINAKDAAINFHSQQIQFAQGIFDVIDAISVKPLKKRYKKNNQVNQTGEFIDIKIKYMQKARYIVQSMTANGIQVFFKEFSKNINKYKAIYQWVTNQQFFENNKNNQCQCIFGEIIDGSLLYEKERMCDKQKDKAKFDQKFRLGAEYQCLICGMKKNRIKCRTEILKAIQVEYSLGEDLQTERLNNRDPKQTKETCSTASNTSQSQQLQEKNQKEDLEEQQQINQLERILSFIENIQIKQENRKYCCITEQWIQQINKQAKVQIRRSRKSKNKVA